MILIELPCFSLLQKQPHLKKLQWGPPANFDLLEQLYGVVVVDGSSTFVPGDDFGEEQEAEEQDEDEGEQEAEEQGVACTPMTRSTTSQRSKSKSTLSSLVKKIKSPMVRYVRDIAHTFQESVNVNTEQLKKKVLEKEAYSVKKCQELGWECGIEPNAQAVFAMSKFFETEYQRKFFCGLPTPELRLGYFNNWCRENNLE
jgi:hypothetical protein